MTMANITFRAMGSTITALIEAGTPAAEAALARLPLQFERWEQTLSRFRPDSELNRLNRAGGQPLRVSPTLWAVLKSALRAAQVSNGLVTPALLAALEEAGYDRSFEQLAELATSPPALHRRSPPSLDLAAIRFDRRRQAVTLPPGLRLDLGGIAKGWAATRAARELAAFGPALVDAGGDIAVQGRRTERRPWPVGVADPLHEGALLGVVQLAGGAVATSGRDYRRWMQDGRLRHHILDPRTGQPAQSTVLTATVTAPDGPAAEMAAKCALILGPDAGPRWLDTRPELAGLLVLESGALVPSRRWLPRWEPYGEATAAGETARQSHDQCKGDIQ
jgi:thiamine biosynthesis lipoprotein